MLGVGMNHFLRSGVESESGESRVEQSGVGSQVGSRESGAREYESRELQGFASFRNSQLQFLPILKQPNSCMLNLAVDYCLQTDDC